jgi:hypothetical protein
MITRLFAASRLVKLAKVSIAYAVLLVGAVATVFPLLWTVSTSLKTIDKVTAVRLELIPDPVAWWNYVEVFQIAPVARQFRNTMFIVIAVVLGSVITSSFVAYGFARIEFPGRDLLFTLLLSTMMMPGVVTLIPRFVMALGHSPAIGTQPLLHLFDAPVLSRHSAGVVRRSPNGRLFRVWHLVENRHASVRTSACSGGHILIPVVVERFPLSTDLLGRQAGIVDACIGAQRLPGYGAAEAASALSDGHVGAYDHPYARSICDRSEAVRPRCRLFRSERIESRNSSRGDVTADHSRLSVQFHVTAHRRH